MEKQIEQSNVPAVNSEVNRSARVCEAGSTAFVIEATGAGENPADVASR